MEANIKKWGNSRGIRIPKSVLEKLNLEENDRIDITVKGDQIVITKIDEREYKNLQERLEAFYGKPIDKIKTIEGKEVSTGKPVGEEIW